jgi:hypothetical protein
VSDLKEIFKQAAEIAQQVPENMQEADFPRALDLLTSRAQEDQPRRRSARPRHTRERSVNQDPNQSLVASPTTDSGKKARKSATRVGPKTAILSLIESGFFVESKSGPAVQEYLCKKRGFDLDTPQLRMTMLRLVREGTLEREENQDGQFEYKQPSNR